MKIYFLRLAAVLSVGFFFTIIAVCFPVFAVYYVATGIDLAEKFSNFFDDLGKGFISDQPGE